jgi:DnaJ-domain-containing protein 1
MAIDRYKRVADNLAAVAATLDAMRAIERHGGAEILNRAFLGFAALPEKASQPWREVLGIAPESPATLDLIQSRYRALVKLHHPDIVGDEGSEEFQRIVQARDAAVMELAS